MSEKMNHNAIDTHAHVYPAFYLDMLEKEGVDPESTKIARNLNADSTAKDMAKRLEWMDKADVSKQVLAVTPQVPKTGASARAINDEYQRILADYPGRFLAYAALPLPNVEESLTELERIAGQNFVGVSFPALLRGGGSLVERQLMPVWEMLNDRAMVVNIHPTGQAACATPLTDFNLHWVNGAPMEDAIATLHLLKADIPHRFPNIKLHIAHLGGDLPFLFQRIEDNYADWGAFERSPQGSLRKMYFDAANFYEPALRLAVEAYGKSQIMSGSDIPYFQENKYLRAFDYIRYAELDSSTRTAILQENAKRLYGLN